MELGAASLGRARDAMAGYGSPGPDGAALDLGRIIEGSLHEPAHWWREGGRVRLRTDRGDDEPSPWVEEWDSTEDLLLTDTPAARATAARLIAEASRARSERAAQIDREVRDAGVSRLRELAPDLVVRTGEVPEGYTTVGNLVCVSDEDLLTGLRHRWRLEELAQGSRAMVADLKSFRDRVNVPFGHQAGDEVLRTIAQRLMTGLAPRQVLRIGADEFAIEVLDGDDWPDPSSLVSRVRDLVGRPIPKIEISRGVGRAGSDPTRRGRRIGRSRSPRRHRPTAGRIHASPHGRDRRVDRARHRDGSSAVAQATLADDPFFPIAVLRGRQDLALEADAGPLLAYWAPGVTRETGTVRYRWAINPRFEGPYPAWVGPIDTWHPWRPADAAAWAERPQRGMEDIERLLTPLVLAESLDLLHAVGGRSDAQGDLARSFIDEALPKVRRDAALWVMETRAWADTWALWTMARRPGALTLLYPFAAAIAGSYAASAQRAGGKVLGTRFPFHGVPLVSGSAHLAAGLMALGVHPNLTGDLAAWTRAQQRVEGGWGDGDGPSDLLTTLVTAELLASLDPAYDPLPTAVWFGRQQRPDGWWRACGPEATWLSVEILAWLRRSGRPFAERFAWPHLSITNRDRRTGLPFYGYFADLERLFQAIPGLARAPIDVAFIDLAGFGTFNDAFGMAQGDEVLRTFAQALTRIPGTMAIRDGGDEFIVLGTPTGTGLSGRMADFRRAWAAEFASAYGQGVVAPRILVLTTTGERIVDARNELGIRIARLKDEVQEVGPLGIQRDLGPLG